MAKTISAKSRIGVQQLKDARAEIRKYKDSDEKEITRLFDKFQDFIVAVDPLKRLTRKPGYGDTYLQHTLKEIAKHNGIFYVAEANDKVVGFVVAIVHKPSVLDRFELKSPTIYGEVTELYVDPSYRGNDIGTMLMLKAEAYLKYKGCKDTMLYVFVPNKGAHKFYKKLGYLDRNLSLLKKI